MQKKLIPVLLAICSINPGYIVSASENANQNIENKPDIDSSNNDDPNATISTNDDLTDENAFTISGGIEGTDYTLDEDTTSLNALAKTELELSGIINDGKSNLSGTNTIQSPTPMSLTQTPDIASAADNGLYWINKGATYRSGATLQFYATGAGYGPAEPQELNPVDGSTRYIPATWSVSTSSSGNSAKGSWKKYTEETVGGKVSGYYSSGEYRYKASFRLNTTVPTSVPYTLRVNYKKQTYNDEVWKDTGGTVSKSVHFYIRNVDIAETDGSEFSIKNNSKITVGSKTILKVKGLVTTPTFSSSDKTVAKINRKGRITALKVGTTTITVKAPALGQYRVFKKSISIRIVPKSVKIKSAVSIKKGRLTVKSNASNKSNTGYKIQYKYSSGKATTINVKSKNALNYTIKDMKPGKNCSVRICAYKKVNSIIYSGFYSAWIKVRVRK